MLEDEKDCVLAAWREGLVSDAEIATWAERRLLACPDDAIPTWLLQLIESGPGACQEIAGFPWPEPLDYVAAFSLRAASVALADDDAVLAFAHWASRRAIGNDDELPEVALGYYLDHLLDDCRRDDWAVDHVRKELPPLLDACRARAARLRDLLDR